MDNMLLTILALIGGFVIGAVVVWLIHYLRSANEINKASKFLEDAKNEAEKHKRDTLLELKKESFELKQQTDTEIKEKKAEIKESEERLISRENNLDKREEILQKRDLSLQEKENNLAKKQESLQEKEAKMGQLLKEELAELEKIAGFSKEKAHDMIMAKVEDDMQLEIVEYIKEAEAKAKVEAAEKAKQIIVNSMES